MGAVRVNVFEIFLRLGGEDLWPLIMACLGVLRYFEGRDCCVSG